MTPLKYSHLSQFICKSKSTKSKTFTMHKHYEYDKLSACITANLFGATSETNSNFNFKATTQWV